MLKRMAAVCMAAVFFASALPCAYAEGSEPIKIAVPRSGGTGVDGYTYDYVNEITKYSNEDYELVTVDCEPENQNETLLNAIDSGKADIAGGLMLNDEISDSYAHLAYGMVELMLLSVTDSKSRFRVDFHTMQDMNVAVLRSDEYYKTPLERYCEVNLLSPKYIECETLEEQIEAVKSGEADAFLARGQQPVLNSVIISRFSSGSYYFAASEKNADLLNAVDEAIISLDTNDPFFQTDLMKKYYSADFSYELSKSEKEYIGVLGTLDVAVVLNSRPYSYKDPSSGELSGITIDVLNLISQNTGMKFNIVAAETYDEFNALISGRTVDIIAGTVDDYQMVQNKSITLSREYLSSQCVAVMNSSVRGTDLSDKRMAVSNSIEIPDGNENIMIFPSLSACVKAVSSGAADYAYVDQITAQYYLNHGEYGSLKTAPQLNRDFSQHLGVIKPIDVKLLTILNKAIDGLTDDDIQKTILQNTAGGNPQTFGETLESSMPILLTVTSVFAAIVFILLAYSGKRDKKKARQLSLEIQKHLQLFDIAGDFFFEYNYSDGELTISDFSKTLPIYPLFMDYYNNSRDEAIQTFQKLKSGTSQISIFTMSGGTHWLSVTAKVMYDEGSEPLCLIGKIEDIDEAKKEREALTYEAERDSLTKLYNPSTIRRVISSLIAGLPEGEHGAFILLDIDKFKQINDTFGHMQGDDVLQSLAMALNSIAYEDGAISRFGGDEFMIYFKSVSDKNDLNEKCTIICEVARTVPINSEHNLTVSVGAVLSSSGDDFDKLYQTADDALYISKEKGRDCFTII